MTLGEKLRIARQEAGLSQRQLCGDTITRNMLSQIEHGTAHPSMDTLRFLAARLGKPMSYFLEEEVLQSPNQAVMEQARAAFRFGRGEELRAVLADYQSPDPVFDEEWRLLTIHSLHFAAEAALSGGRDIFAAELLSEAERIGADSAYYTKDLARQTHLLQGRIKGAKPQEICKKLPDLDEELLLRSEAALSCAETERCLWLLGAAENQATPRWNYLRGELYLSQGDFSRAAICFHKAETAYPEAVFPKLELCYRELEDYRRAYEYACRQKK